MFKNGSKCIFDTHGYDTTWNSRSGCICSVIRPLTEAEADLFEVGPMYHIRFEDGIETDAFEEELELMEMEA